MDQFPSGHLVMRTFPRLSSAHQAASQITEKFSGVRLLEVGLVADAAWVCGWSEKKIDGIDKLGFSTVAVSAATVNAYLSLAPAVPDDCKTIAIFETETSDFADFFAKVEALVGYGAQAVEVRVRKAGLKGAHAFFAISNSFDQEKLKAISGITVLELRGDYRRFFI